MFGIDLGELVRVKSWRWFVNRVNYLLTIDGPLRFLLIPDSRPDPTRALAQTLGLST